jgi:predicted CoA-binding protein
LDHDHYPDAYLRDILAGTRRIALVGASLEPSRPSHYVMQFLLERGYEVVPVNPTIAGQEIHGQKVLASLAEVPPPIDLVDVFRNSQAAARVTDEAIAAGAKAIWMQMGVRNDEAASRAEAAGLKVVMNRCPKVEFPRLFGSRTVAEIAA